MTEGIRWLSFGPPSGYGIAADAYLHGLRAAGVPVCWTPLGWPSTVWRAPLGPVDAVDDTSAHADIANRPIAHDTVVVQAPVFWHDRLAEEARGKRLVAFTTWESDRLPRAWPAMLGHFDQVLVPSRFNEAVFAASGLTVPIAVVPHIARPLPARPLPADPLPSAGHRRVVEPDDRRFVVYMVATWTSRKAILDAVEAFTAAFGAADDVVLVIHTTPEDQVATARPPTGGGTRRNGEGASWFTLARALAGRTDVPDIVLSTRTLSAAEIDDLHRRGDCFLSLSRGEGWGLGAFEAAAAGNPVIVTGWGATREFLPDGYPYLVDYDLVPTTLDPPDMVWQPDEGERWARARVAHAAGLLRHVYDHRHEARSWGRRSRAHVLATFDSVTVTGQLLTALDTPARPRHSGTSTAGPQGIYGRPHL